jgi:chemotaxis protein CheX
MQMTPTEQSTTSEELDRMSEAIEQTVRSVFETMMSLPVEPVQAGRPPEASRVTATLHFAGIWNGVLMLEVTRSMACYLASQFLGFDTPELDDNVRDVLGELSNMIGGNLKCALAPGALLSMPEVIDGEFSLRICAGTVCCKRVFRCESGDFWVSLMRTPGAGA